MKESDLISIITVNYNGFSDTCNLIESWINTIHSIPYEFIIIDNGSKVNEAELIKEKYPTTTVYRSEKNLGFAGANNIGVKISKGNILFFINNDTIIIKDTLDIFIKALDNKKIAGISPLILNNDEKLSIQFAGYTKMSNITLRNRAIIDVENPLKSKKTEFLHGAAMLFKRETIDKVGLMNEDYFLYYEELDWCERFKKQGYDLYLEPSFSIIHKNSGTIGMNSPIKAYYLTRNRLFFAYNNFSRYNLVLIILYHIFIAYPYHIAKAMISGRFNIAKAEIKGIVDFFKIII